MYRMTIAAAVALLATAPAFAQSSLGLTGAELRFGLGDTSGSPAYAEAQIDLAITEYHGAQGDVWFTDTASGAIAGVAGHLYMTPRPGQKYGVFAFVADADGRSATYGGGGIEAMFDLGERVTVETRAGIGLTHRTGFDFIFGAASMHYALTPDITASATLALADFDEAAFSARTAEATLGLHWKPGRQPWGLFAEVSHDAFSGRSAQPGETTLRAGFTLEFGGGRGTGGAHDRKFSRPDPLRPLTKRGLF